VPHRKRKKPLRGIGVAVGAFSPNAPNVVWAMHFQFDQTADGKMLKLLIVTDEFSGEALAIDVKRSIDADDVVTCLERLADERGTPAYVRPQARVHRLRGGRLMPVQRHQHRAHRPGQPVTERLDRELQRPPARRTVARPAVRLTARGEGLHRGL
jgi:transposase InsO family protein